LPVVIGQRVTSGEAIRSWRQLCLAAGEPAPGPRPLRLPPAPSAIARQPYWWFHRFGIERKRADALRAVAAHAHHLDRLDELGDPVEARRVLSTISGVGVWTIGMTLGPCLGDPDAVAVGDFWIPHAVCWALAGEPRGSDDRMLELLEPYVGQRGRAVNLLFADGWRAPRFGPGRRIIPIAKW
jgi:3-methyladenine DNA glycosylase/8-oxoguanine DNA glycosylase